MLDTLITDGCYPDFERDRMIEANIGIENGKISYIGGQRLPARRLIDAADRVVSPGFIDIHMHEENFQEDGPSYIIGELMLKMGVTTVCGGNCGMQNQRLSQFKRMIERLGGAPVNYVMLAGYNQMRYLLGIGHNERISPKQQRQVLDLLREELEEGARGISFGIEYDPAITFDEMAEALMLLHGNQRYLAAAHFRQSAEGALESIKEMIALSEVSGTKFQISHLGSCSATGQMAESLELIDEAKKKHLGVDFDIYPYNAFSTLIGSEVFEKESLDQWCKDIGTIMLTQEPYKNVYCTEDLLEKARSEYPDMLAVGFIMDEEEIAQAMSHKCGMIASDGILNGGKGHPRAAGTFPRVLGRYVREQKRLSLLDVLRKMTLYPAERLSLSAKGRIAIGADADLTIFDPETILDCASYDNLYQQPEGIDYVLIGGYVALDHKQVADDRLGSFISFF